MLDLPVTKVLAETVVRFSAAQRTYRKGATDENHRSLHQDDHAGRDRGCRTDWVLGR